MAKRVWQADQDQQLETPQGIVPIVSQQALVKAVIDGAIMLDRAGGTLSVVLVRQSTGMPGEMLTQMAIVEWKDHTRARAQPELANPFEGAEGAELSAPAVTAAASSEPDEPVEFDGEQAAPAPASDELIGDGLDNPEIEVDESSIPAALR